MRQMLMIIGVLAMVAVVLAPACAQQGPADDNAAGDDGGFGRGGQHGRLGPAAQGQRGRQGQQGREQGMGQDARAVMGRGYIETNPETKALWDQLGELKTQLHQAQWELYEALNQEGATRETVKPQLEKMKEIGQQVRGVMEQLAPYRKQLERPQGQQDRPRRHKPIAQPDDAV